MKKIMFVSSTQVQHSYFLCTLPRVFFWILIFDLSWVTSIVATRFVSTGFNFRLVAPSQSMSSTGSVSRLELLSIQIRASRVSQFH